MHAPASASCRGGRVVTIDIGASPYTGVCLDLGSREIWLVTTRNDLSASQFLIHPIGASIVIMPMGDDGGLSDESGPGGSAIGRLFVCNSLPLNAICASPGPPKGHFEY